LSNVDNMIFYNVVISGPIGNWWLCVPQTTQLFGFVLCIWRHLQIWNK